MERLGDKDKVIQCEVCAQWFHTKCEEVPDESYKVLVKDDGVNWYCRGCDKGIAKVLTDLAVVM